MAESHHHLRREGDYFVQANAELTRRSLEKSLQSHAVGDFANICLQWFVRPPKSIKESLSVMNDLHEVVQVRLTPLSVSGAW
jgi:hypothetical protein